MTMITSTRRPVKPARVRVTRTLFDPAVGVGARVPVRFGAGLIGHAAPAALDHPGPLASACWEDEAWDATVARSTPPAPIRRTPVTGEPMADPAAPYYSQTRDLRDLVRIFGY